MKKKRKEFEPDELLGGMLNILGIKIDLGELLGSPEKLIGQVEELREKLKAAGGKESLPDEEWRQGGVSVTGHIRARGILGDQEYHIGTFGRPRKREKPSPAPSEVAEPPVDVFDEPQQVTVVADIPGVSLEDLDLKLQGNTLSISTKGKAWRSYRKEVRLQGELEPGSMKATCRNGVLEVRLRKRGTGSG
jgi:HSP20 family protein